MSCNRPSLICSALEELHPEFLVVCGYGVTGMIAALRWPIHADRMVAVVTLSDSTEDDRMRSWWKEKLKQQIIKQSGASLVAGLRHRDYMLSLGMPENKVFTGYDVVDNDFFWHGAQEVRRQIVIGE